MVGFLGGIQQFSSITGSLSNIVGHGASIFGSVMHIVEIREKRKGLVRVREIRELEERLRVLRRLAKLREEVEILERRKAEEPEVQSGSG